MFSPAMLLTRQESWCTPQGGDPRQRRPRTEVRISVVFSCSCIEEEVLHATELGRRRSIWRWAGKGGKTKAVGRVGRSEVGNRTRSSTNRAKVKKGHGLRNDWVLMDRNWNRGYGGGIGE